MPARQPTPGPSTLTAQADVLQPHNAKKRAVSELLLDDEPRQSKKHRKDLETLNGDDKAIIANSNSTKDSKKKRKKKKRKLPPTIPDIQIEPVTAKPKPAIITVVPVSGTSSSTLSETSLSSPAVKTEKLLFDGTALHPESFVSAAEVEEGPALTAANKGKRRAISELPDNLISLAQGSALAAGPSHDTDPLKEAQAQIAELTAQLQSQKKLLSRYGDNLSNLQQSLTCEICLDLLYKPFSLSPCGHVVCYMCLIRWFTSTQNRGGNDQYNVNPPAELDDIPILLNSRAATRGTFLRHRKTCPLCRASITSRPSEVWSIKSMVANLVKSNLVALPSAPPPSATETPDAGAINNPRNDPWHNIFPKTRHQHHHRPQFYPPPPENNEGGQEWGIEDMGMYDAEDGGIYRCLDCMHEIWGGVCTSCNREYRGHARFDDDDDGDDDGDFDDDGGDGFLGGNILGRRLREIIRGYNEPAFGWGPEEDEDDDDEIDLGEFYDAHDDPVELTDDESISDEGSDQGLHTADEEWSTEDDGEEDNGETDIRYHFHDLPLWREVGMLREVPVFPAHRIDYGGPAPVARIEQIEENEEEEEEEEEEENDSESESESDHSHPDSELEYETSCIDDGEDDHGEINGDDDNNDGLRRLQHYGDFEDNMDEPEDHEYRSIAGRLGRGMRFGAPSPPLVIRPLTVRGLLHNVHRGGRESPIDVDNEQDDDDEAEVDPPLAGPSRSRRTRRQAHRALIDVEGDDDGEAEDEVPEVRPYRRRAVGPGTASDRRRRQMARLYDDESE